MSPRQVVLAAAAGDAGSKAAAAVAFAGRAGMTAGVGLVASGRSEAVASAPVGTKKDAVSAGHVAIGTRSQIGANAIDLQVNGAESPSGCPAVPSRITSPAS